LLVVVFFCLTSGWEGEMIGGKTFNDQDEKGDKKDFYLALEIVGS
jgi:hypothetical protein